MGDGEKEERVKGELAARGGGSHHPRLGLAVHVYNTSSNLALSSSCSSSWSFVC